MQHQPGSRSSRGSKAIVPQALFQNMFKSDEGGKTRKKYQQRVDRINGMESKYEQMDDEQLKQQTEVLRSRVGKGEALESVLPEAFAVVREGSKRVLNMRPFDVQLIGGMILHEGEIAEMRTGEGKTLVSVLPAYLNALSGKGVHVVTVNDYLAKRDSEWVGQIHKFLGLDVGLVQQGLDNDERRKAYNCDVTYVTNSELGFDYLRDNLAQSADELVLRGFNFCVIDEVDSILIDEARTPLIISGPAEKPSEKYQKASKLAKALAPEVHYTVDEKQKSILITEDGYEAAEDVLQVSDLYDPREQWASYLINAIKAKELQKRDVNYIVKQDEIIIVDEFTGRTMPGRRWGEGLHQAVEAKEGVPIQDETITLASISYQNFFRSYPKLAGMTGTASTESAEFSSTYDLAVTVVPTNKPTKREDAKDVVFATEEYKWKAVVQEIRHMHKSGRPVLVGTTSVERSEGLAGQLDTAGIQYQLLNAKPENVERESETVAQSGRKGAVTIATNMAGRGTDILLGGNSEYMARLKLRESLLPQVVSQVEGANPVSGSRNAGRIKDWKVSPDLFPVEASDDAKQLISSAVKAAVGAWGERQLTELEAEDRLAFACEKAPTSDPTSQKLREAFQALQAEYKVHTETAKAEVIELGGLHVVGTERHESRRIDNQLRGRTARQGDPGSTRYFLSLEDNLFRIFGGDRIKGMMNMLQIGELPIESGMLTKSLDEAQRKVEAYFFDQRRQLFEYDQVLNTQRDKVYGQRRRALLSKDLSKQMLEFAERTVDDILEANVDPRKPFEEWELEKLANKMRQYCPLLEDMTGASLEQVCGTPQGGDYEKLRTHMQKASVDAYHRKAAAIDEHEAGLMQAAQRFFVLTQTDNLWKEHLQAIKFLQQAVSLRGYAQRDPLVEYKLEGYNLFLEMMANIRRNVIYNVYVFQPRRNPEVTQQPAAQEQHAEQPAEEQPTAAALSGSNGTSNGSHAQPAQNGAAQNGSGSRQPQKQPQGSGKKRKKAGKRG
jgi:preprotein translocase subunit SecA